jgi:hypothetical protein
MSDTFTVIESELEALEKLEKAVKAGLEDAMKAYGALKEIRDRDLYTQRGHKSFNAYLDSEWGMSKRSAYRMITAFETRERLNPLDLPVENQSIKTESQLRILSGVEDKDMADVIEEAADIASDEGSRLTAKVLSRAKEKVLGPASTSSKDASVADNPTEPTQATTSDVTQFEPEGSVESEITDPVVIRAKKKLPELIRSTRLQLGNMGFGTRFDGHLDQISQAVESVR